MPSRIRSTGGGAGATAPTVILLDKGGFKDGAETLVWSLPDTVGFKDFSPAWAANHGDTTGYKDSAVIAGLGTPQWQSVTTTALSAAAASITVNKPTGTVSGDLLLASICTANPVAIGQSTVATPAGWTLVNSVGLNGTVAALALYTFRRVANGTEGATFVFTFGGPATASQATAEVHRLTGINTTTPIDNSATATLVATALVTNPVSPTVTTGQVNTLVFCFLNHYHATLANSHTPPTSHTEVTDFESTNTVKDSSTSDLLVFAAAGATGTATHTCTETASTDAVMQRVAVAPGNISISL